MLAAIAFDQGCDRPVSTMLAVVGQGKGSVLQGGRGEAGSVARFQQKGWAKAGRVG